ncbi:alpha/beta fold hydrolase [Tepidiforma flava]|uniref:Alpha/beta fold hydrolase n=1 Tax=Tepidiforma flava TaxID=3004094 RepID=A0ABY7M945_9CHLR|nr:alpha/beta fold hydrolase [Tepidiforma flava]WBL36945.1 alpha/beta fold hydrolase [Tepidiforma flava]
MPYAPSNGIELYYETHGDPGGRPLLLVMGLGAQLTLWEPGLCDLLVRQGFYVIRFDNRDVGLSSKIEGGPQPDIAKAMAGDHSTASYTLWDMADDAAGLLDHLGIARAHIAGASMGGMIVQCMAIRHGSRVRSMTSIMSTTGNPAVGQPQPEAMAALLAPPPESREAAIEQGLKTWKIIGSPGYPPDEAELRARLAADYDRCFYPEGTARQLVAILATGDRTEGLRGVRVPTLVIHGEADPLVTLSGGQATAEAVPGARLLTFPGMGHDLPKQLWPQFAEALAELAREADGG